MSRKGLTPEITAKLVEESPIGRLGQPAEIAAAVVWLCDPSSGFLTGQAIAVDGAWTAR
jgi:Tropinone reductase 1